jgi:hypothetical protein
MPLVTTLNGVPINDDTLAGKGYLTSLTGTDGVTLPNFLAQNWAIYKASLATVGTTWRVGGGVPSNALGIDGDFFLSTSGNVYLRTSGAYVFQTSLIGPAGSGSTIHASQNGAGVTVAPRSRINFIGLNVADNAGSDRIDVSTAVPYSGRTSNTILGATDRNYLVDITSGTFTQTFSAASTLGSGWWLYLRNSGTGDITLDPNGAETIDGLTTFIMYPGEVRLIQCDGTALRSFVIESFVRTFNASGTFTKPPGYSQFGVRAWSGGGSGQKSGATNTQANGGGGGGCGDFILLASTVGTTETVTIGAGGAAVTGIATGNLGGNTTLGALLTVFAGPSAARGGSIVSQAMSQTGSPALGFEGANSSSTTFACGSVYGGSASPTNSTVASGNAIYGGAAGGGVDNTATVRAPGVSTQGGNGGAASSAGSGTAGSQPGGGGGATQTGAASGAGGDGAIRIWGDA